jgi:hypothetical protein
VRPQDGAAIAEKASSILVKFLPAAAKAWVEGPQAKKIAWNSDLKTYEQTDYPDHKIRSECAEKIWHNVVGRPLERSLQVSGSYKELSVLIDELKQLPEARRLLPPELFDSLLSTTEGKESVPAPEGMSNAGLREGILRQLGKLRPWDRSPRRF